MILKKYELALDTCLSSLNTITKNKNIQIKNLVKNHLNLYDPTILHYSTIELLAIVIRKKLASLFLSTPNFNLIFDLLDITLEATINGYVDNNLPFTCLEDLFDFLTVDGCERLFHYLESRVDKLIIDMSPNKGKGLTLLRFCNELLRRLSKSKNTETCGRILIFLSSVFPLCERSGVNHKGDFNIDNHTLIDSDILIDLTLLNDTIPEDLSQSMDINDQSSMTNLENQSINQNNSKDISENLTPSDKSLIQPKSITLSINNPESKDQQETQSKDQPQPESKDKPETESKDTTESLNKDKQDTLPNSNDHMNLKPNDESNQKSQTDPIDLDSFYNQIWDLQKYFSNPPLVFEPTHFLVLQSNMDSVIKKFEEIQAENDQMLSERKRRHRDERSQVVHTPQHFFPKYLTSKKLFDLQLSDPFFRRQILTQFLILSSFLCYCLEITKTPGVANKSVQYTLSITPEQEQWLQTCKTKTLKILERISPHGRTYYKTIISVMTHEKNWVNWKENSCKTFELNPINDINPTTRIRGLKASKATDIHFIGNDELDRLWTFGKDLDEQLKGTRDQTYLKELDEMMEMMNSQVANDLKTPLDGLEEEYFVWHDKRFNWLLYRKALQTHLGLFSNEKIGIDNQIPAKSLLKSWRIAKGLNVEDEKVVEDVKVVDNVEDQNGGEDVKVMEDEKGLEDEKGVEEGMDVDSTQSPMAMDVDPGHESGQILEEELSSHSSPTTKKRVLDPIQDTNPSPTDLKKPKLDVNTSSNDQN
ncbi:THO complex subunit 1 transcription elongation factor-domain-containing protein [Globomyces pollinis-pini]|nr:THO complex subunit 1 transcription elongation factor-domain-containing protein [Globomyces pollinis-pini]